ncbi:hypothetical protein MK280_01425 [Myxococcota bacterium]|nr:hypothetical protein [Myxococcota bacterium]
MDWQLRAPATRGHSEQGSIVTFAVAIFMLVALLFYLIVAFFHEDTPAENPTAASASASVDSTAPEKSVDPATD